MISPVSSANSMSNVTSIYNYGIGGRYLARTSRAAMPEVPVTPVRQSTPVSAQAPSGVRLQQGGGSWDSAYYAAGAARSRVEYPQGYAGGLSPDIMMGSNTSLPFQAENNILPGAYPAELSGRMRISYPISQGAENGASPPQTDAALGAEGAQKALDEGRCETCEQRKYQDGSDDISVSFQTPTEIDPDSAASAVRGHEMEHVYHEQAKAQRENRKVVSQTVTLHTDICPECGRAYISGGTTRTVTKANESQQTDLQQEDQPDQPKNAQKL